MIEDCGMTLWPPSFYSSLTNAWIELITGDGGEDLYDDNLSGEFKPTILLCATVEGLDLIFAFVVSIYLYSLSFSILTLLSSLMLLGFSDLS